MKLFKLSAFVLGFLSTLEVAMGAIGLSLLLMSTVATTLFCGTFNAWCIAGALLIGFASSFIYQTIDMYVGTKARLKNKGYDLQDIFYEGLANVIAARVSIWITGKLEMFGWFKGIVKIGIDAATGFLISSALKAVLLVPRLTPVPILPTKTFLKQGTGR